MKPVNINLVVKRKIWGKIPLGIFALLVLAACGFSIANIYDYYANQNVIQAYEARYEKISKKAGQNRVKTPKISKNSKENEKKSEDLKYFKTIINKSLFPLAEVLTQIEKVKPDKIDINELNFSDNLKTIVIKGASNNVTQVSKFIIEMERLNCFILELSKEEINSNKRIIFELTARWVSLKPDGDLIK